MKNESERKRWQREAKRENKMRDKSQRLIHLITYGVMRTRMTYFSCFRCACTNVGFEYKCNRYTPMMIFATQWIETHLHAVCISVGEEEIICWIVFSFPFSTFLLLFIALFVGVSAVSSCEAYTFFILMFVAVVFFVSLLIFASFTSISTEAEAETETVSQKYNNHR